MTGSIGGIFSHQILAKEKIDAFGLRLMLLMHFCGLIGMLYPPVSAWFVALTPLNLICSVFFLILRHEKRNQNFWIFALLAFSIGFGTEWLGVHTGLIFGQYAYGKTLGWAIDGIPLLIGVNWFMLSYSTNVIAEEVFPARVRPFAAAAMMTGADFLIEPGAIRFDMWHWYGAMPPLQNYAAWFVVSFVIALLYGKLMAGTKNFYAKCLFAAQTAFFGILFLLS
jgi:putative membrane protein